MNKEYINECIDIIEQIKFGSIIEITKDKQSLKFKMIEGIDEAFELVCLSEEDTIWNDGETIEEIKEDLLCSAIRNRYQKIRLV